MSALYENDFHAWTSEQAALLRAGRFNEADIANLVEEIESMGRGERRELVNRLTVLLLHLLKWRFQPERRGSSWEASIRRERLAIKNHIAENPSLKPFRPEAVEKAYEFAVIDAAGETKLASNIFPSVNPWTWEQMMDAAYWPPASV